jgi:hypothetical protein
VHAAVLRLGDVMQLIHTFFQKTVTNLLTCDEVHLVFGINLCLFENKVRGKNLAVRVYAVTCGACLHVKRII